jgi:LPXTG-motif cell wall-anchored protein
VKFRLSVLLSLALSAALISPARAAGAYGEFSADAGSLSLSGTAFPSAVITTSGNSLAVARSATLTGSSPFGTQYGTSSGKTYLSIGLTISAAEPASTTLTFASATPTAGWSVALGDVDAESVAITATGEGGVALNVSGWYAGSFNYQSGQTDQPTWSGNLLSGRGSDTGGAAAWFTPNAAVTSITFTQRRLVAGGPSYQLWIAADPDTFPTTTTSTSSSTSTSSTSSTSSTTTTTTTLPDSTLEAPVITADDVARDGDSYVIELTKDNTGLPGIIDVVDASTTEPGELTFADNVISFTPSAGAEGRVAIDYVAKNGAGRFASGRIRFELKAAPSLDAALPSTGSDTFASFGLLGVMLAATGATLAARHRAR